MRDYERRLARLEEAANRPGQTGPYDPASKPPFDYAKFEQLFYEQLENCTPEQLARYDREMTDLLAYLDRHLP